MVSQISLILFENDDLALVNTDFDFWQVKIYGNLEHVIHPFAWDMSKVSLVFMAIIEGLEDTEIIKEPIGIVFVKLTVKQMH